jgi:PPOX class probable F420-dependent enzyme
MGLWTANGERLGDATPGTNQSIRWAADMTTQIVDGAPVNQRPDTGSRNRDAAEGVAGGVTFDMHALLAASRIGVLATMKSDGRPQLSPVMPYYDRPAGVIYVSTAEGLAKTANIRRDPRVSLQVTSTDGRSWATAEGNATLIGPGSDPEGPQVQALVDYYRAAAGEHPDWAEYRAVMVANRRVLITMTVDKVYGAKIS